MNTTFSRAIVAAICLLFSFSNLKAQDSVQIPKESIFMKKFNLELYQENQRNLRYKYQSGDSIIHMAGIGNKYIELISLISTGYDYTIEYYTDVLTIKEISCKLFDCRIYVKRYGKSGNLIEDIEHGNNYKISVDQIRDFIKKEDQIDIFERTETYRYIRRTTNPYPHYSIYFMSNKDEPTRYIIDANTGEIIQKVVSGKKIIDKPQPSTKEQSNKKSWLDKLFG